MNMLRFYVFGGVTFVVLCLSLRQNLQAQTLPIPLGTGAGAPIITATPTSTGIPPVAVPTSSEKFPPRRILKYYEYKPICIQPEPEEHMMSAEVKEKRLNLIQQKLKKSEETKDKSIMAIKALLIKEYLKQKLDAKAEDLFKKEGHLLSETDQVVISAEIDISQNHLKQARNNLNKYLEAHPKDIAALEKLSEVYTLLNSHIEARMVLEDLRKVNTKKDYSLALCENAVLNADHFNIKLYCEKLSKQDSLNYLAPVYLGISLRDQEQYPEAIKNFKLSLKIKPSEFASTCLAENYFLIKDYKQAIQQYEESIKIQPNSKRSHLGLANAYVKNNLFAEALEQFKISCQLGLKPFTEMSAAANILKNQKSLLTEKYFNEMANCRK